MTDRAWKLLNTLIPILVTVNMAITGYVLKQLGDIATSAHIVDMRVTTIEANRFTSKDAASLMQFMLNIEKTVAALPKEVPPAWFLERVKHLERRIEKLESK